MEILNHNAKKAIETAYEIYEKEEFLSRLYDYINSSMDLARQEEQFYDKVKRVAIRLNEKKEK